LTAPDAESAHTEHGAVVLKEEQWSGWHGDAALQVLLNQVSIAEAVAAAQQHRQQPMQQRPRHLQHEAAAQVAVQASAVLRNLSVVAANADLFVQQQATALQALIGLLQPFQQDPEVLFNVSRCLSKLSIFDSCRHGMVLLGGQQGERGSSRNSIQLSSAGKADSNSGSTSVVSSARAASKPAAVSLMVRALLNVQAAQPKQWPTGIRLAFALAQLTTYHAETRPLVAAVAGALDALPGLLSELVRVSSQQQVLQQQQPQTQQEQRQSALAEDLMTKLLRVLANTAIDRTAGPALAAKQATADALVAVLTQYEYEAAEELVLNATAALTNLAFYDTPSNKVRKLCTVKAGWQSQVTVFSRMCRTQCGYSVGSREQLRNQQMMLLASSSCRSKCRRASTCSHVTLEAKICCC
jgi:hypothetical protein